MFWQWQEDDKLFISTKACEEVEKRINNQNFVIVTGNSGSGKSAIIQHIALKYRSRGWNVKMVYEVAEFLNVINAGRSQLQKTLFVVNDPIGKESIDELPFSLWRKHEETLKSCIKKVKLLMSCRKYILNDGRVKGLLKNNQYIVDIDSDQLKLNKSEKKLIWNTHSLSKDLSEKEFADIFQNEAYFPLLCKLYVCHNRYEIDGLRFFKEPVAVFEKEVRDFKTFSKEKYCALVLLVLFNNVLCVDDLLKDRTSRDKY